jgi:hypothetical protein
MKRCASLLSVLLVLAALFPLATGACAQPSFEDHPVSVTTGPLYEAQPEQGEGNWEGSKQGIAYSEFNHRFAGLFVLLFGLTELGHGLRYRLPFWTRLVLPGGLGIIGAYLLVWSDHEAWPIGPLSFAQTFSGQHPEIIQHKFYGVFGSLAAVSETLRRIGWAQHPVWAVPLVVLGLIGAVLLFVHSHGNHPGNHMIALHHALLGSLGMGAAVSSAMVAWTAVATSQPEKKWELAWAGFVIVIGLQLLLYFE